MTILSSLRNSFKYVKRVTKHRFHKIVSVQLPHHVKFVSKINIIIRLRRNLAIRFTPVQSTNMTDRVDQCPIIDSLPPPSPQLITETPNDLDLTMPILRRSSRSSVISLFEHMEDETTNQFDKVLVIKHYAPSLAKLI
jgi:hypothetical protein